MQANLGRPLILERKRLVTAEIIYRMPDHPAILQTFIWQRLDELPDFPRLHDFLVFWSRSIEGKLYSVSIRYSGRQVPEFKYFDAKHMLRLN